jgi:uncharacterized protein with PIN domain
MSAADTAKDVIRIATTAGLAKDVIDLMEKKLMLLEGELEATTRKNTLLEQRISELETSNRQLQEKVQPVDDPSATDLCPYCKRRKGKLVEIRPDKTFGELGVKVEYYKCTNCGKEYDREQGSGGPQFMGPVGRA